MTRDDLVSLEPGDIVRLTGYQRRRATVLRIDAQTVVIQVHHQRHPLRVMPEEIDSIIPAQRRSA